MYWIYSRMILLERLFGMFLGMAVYGFEFKNRDKTYSMMVGSWLFRGLMMILSDTLEITTIHLSTKQYTGTTQGFNAPQVFSKKWCIEWDSTTVFQRNQFPASMRLWYKTTRHLQKKCGTMRYDEITTPSWKLFNHQKLLLDAPNWHTRHRTRCL